MSLHVDRDWWKSLFDEIYLLTDARSVDSAEVTAREVDALCDLLPLRATDRILDLCGGQGRHSLELAGRGYPGCMVYDFSPVLLAHGKRQARERNLPVHFIQGDASQTGLARDRFDHVLLLGNSLGYLPEAVDDLRILREARRLLKAGGWLLVDVADGDRARAGFRPNAWHEIDDRIVVCRERELAGDSIRAREMVICKQRGLVRDRTYAIRIYDADLLGSLARQAGFNSFTLHHGFRSQAGKGDYGFMNDRLLLTAKAG